MAISLENCAASYDGEDGTRHIIGFVDIKIAPAGDNQTLAGDVVAVKTIGAFASSRNGQKTLALGYVSETTAAIKDNSLVLGNPAEAVQQIFKGSATQ